MSDRVVLADIADGILNTLARPVIRIWLQSAEMGDPLLPRPATPHESEPPTHHADRVLLVGNGPAVGYGVLSHDLSLAGHLGRMLTTSSGRATYVTVIADGSMTAGSGLRVLRTAGLEPYDAIVLTLGVNEALSLSSASRWKREIELIAEFVLSPAAPKLQLFFIGVPPLGSISAAPPLVAWLTDRHSRKLNARLAAVCAANGRVTFVPFSPGPAPDLVRYRSTETYREWATEIAPPIAHGLECE